MNQYPGTNFHDLNLDWLLQEMKKCLTEWAETREDWDTLRGENAAFVSFVTHEWDDFKDYVTHYLANLDISTEVSAKIDAMAADGTLLALITADDGEGSALSDVAGDWLKNHTSQATGVVTINDSLTIPGAAADAKAAGVRITNLEVAVDPMLDEHEIIAPTDILSNNNTAMTSNDDGSFTAGTTDYGNTSFGTALTPIPAGDYYLYGVPAGIAFLSTSLAASTTYNNRIAENTGSEPLRIHVDNDVSVCLGFRLSSAPAESITIYPKLIQYTAKVNRALLEQTALADNTDLNTIVTPGIYLLNSAYTYTHAPDFNSGIMIVTRVGNIVNQTINQYGTSLRTYTPNLCIRNGTKDGVTAEWKYIGRKYGLRAAMIGDSITWGRNGNEDDPTDPAFRTEYTLPAAIAHNLGIACDNMGVGSMGWVKEGEGDVIAYDVLSSLTLSDYDAIFFCLGVNDGFSPLGTWNSEDETTIMGQFNKCIKYIMTNRPRIRVIVIAPFNGRNVGSFPDYWYGPRDNPQGYVSRKTLSDTLKQACEYYWIPYIEQYDGPINPYSIDTLIGVDGVHPSNIGYVALGQWLSSKIGAVL